MRIAVVGAGKMGAWLAVVLSKENEIAIFDIDLERAKKVENVKVLDNLADLSSFNPQMLINAVSLQYTIQAFKEIEQHLSKECILCDVASIKGDVEGYYKNCGYRYVSTHPMFGPTFANLDSLREENAIIIKGSDQEAATFFMKFFSSLGLRIFEYTFDEHDQMMAYSLTTPFVSSLVFAGCMEKSIVPGATFARHRKIATGLLSEDDQLLTEILFNPNSVSQIDKITGRLEYLKHIIMGKDREEMKKYLDNLRKNMRAER
ncbi:prephenate dehydrogenase/arogenate dehydrogenase family protein [Candidatus Micrarchaeota archaeon]|nr:prephenate dehydrogenase/arogenate dehydrogenase family protein [Candidatus Micrarchaeota archaeon]MBU1682202.1 prephenate dehydrogenase/arogenate dehydrogenase family protein [Candidatus Micrarchaeota archaeon]